MQIKSNTFAASIYTSMLKGFSRPWAEGEAAGHYLVASILSSRGYSPVGITEKGNIQKRSTSSCTLSLLVTLHETWLTLSVSSAIRPRIQLRLSIRIEHQHRQHQRASTNGSGARLGCVSRNFLK